LKIYTEPQCWEKGRCHNVDGEEGVGGGIPVQYLHERNSRNQFLGLLTYDGVVGHAGTLGCWNRISRIGSGEKAGAHRTSP